MAAAAETIDRHTELELVELEFPGLGSLSVIQWKDSSRQPEKEVYGRSLSTIHRLGTFAVGKTEEEVMNSPEAAQARAEFNTSVEEGFGTDKELGGGLEVRTFESREVINGKVMSADTDRPVSDMTADGLVCAQKTAENDHRFQPQLTRTHWDHANALAGDDMVQGKTMYNTRIVASPFPEEAAAESGDAYWRGIGYVPGLKRGFIQLYHVTESGEMLTGSLSFDGSNKQRIREVFAKYNVSIPDTEITDNWLQYAITDTLTEEDAMTLALDIANQAADPIYSKTTNTVEVTSEHRAVIDTVFNGSYIKACESHARKSQTPETRELIDQLAQQAQYFNARYATALQRMQANRDQFTDDDMVVMHELLVYSAIELMRAFHLQKTATIDYATSQYRAEWLDVSYLQALSAHAFQGLLGNFAADGARNNRGYSACGLEISVGDANRASDNPQDPYGGLDKKTNSETTYKFDKKMFCVDCQAPPKKGETKKWCGPCGLCRACDKKHGGKG